MPNMSALHKYILHSMPSDKRYIRLVVDEHRDKYLFKPFKVTDFAYEGYPFLMINKKIIEAFKIVYDKIVEAGYDVEIINGIIPFARWGEFAHQYRLLEIHSRGKAIDFLIKGKSAKETFAILQDLFTDTDYPFYIVELTTHVHFQFAKTLKTRFIPLYLHRYHNCNKPFKNIFFNPNHRQSRLRLG